MQTQMTTETGKRHKVRVFSVGRDVVDSTFAEDSDPTPRQSRNPPTLSSSPRQSRNPSTLSSSPRTRQHSFLRTSTRTMDSPRRRRKRDVRNVRGDENGRGRGVGRGREDGRFEMDCLDGMESTTEGLTDLERRVQAMRIWGGIEEERKEFLMQQIRKWDGRGGNM